MPQVSCPQCSAVLKLRDDSLIGKPGKCPKCGHRFVLKASTATTEAPPTSSVSVAKTGQASSQGTSTPKETSKAAPLKATRKPKVARRIPDNASPPPTAPQPTPAGQPAPAAQPTATALAEPASPPGGFITESIETGGTTRMRELARKRALQRRRGMLILAALAVCLGVAFWAIRPYLPQPQSQQTAAKAPPKQNKQFLSDRDRLEQLAVLIQEDSPTKGQPITLNYVPPGASIILHLRPADLWRKGSPGEEVRFCLGTAFDTWLTEQITKYCGLPPAEIDEATICLILGARGSDPEITTVVRPVTPLRTSELIQRFGGAPENLHGIDVFKGPERAMVVSRELDAEKRPQFFATAPSIDAENLALAVTNPGIASDAIEQLLPDTDRGRHLTILFQPADIETHQETLLGPDFRPLVTAFRNYFDQTIESAAWSMHFTDTDFVSDLRLRNVPATTPMQTLAKFEGKIDSLGESLVEVVTQINPTALGDRKIVGRLPAMAELVSVATVGGIADRAAIVQARLPERAAPNLALASLLAWHASLNAPAAPTSPGEMPEGKPVPLAERLKKPIEIDFRNTPLEDAFAYIGGETDVEFDIDGDALKLSGYTRNMPQTFALGNVPADQGVAGIVNNPKQDQMAVVLDEAKNIAIVTTKAVAEQKGLQPATFPLP